MPGIQKTASECSQSIFSKTQECYHSRFAKGGLVTLLAVGIIATLIGTLTVFVLSPQFAHSLSSLSALGAMSMKGAISMTTVGGAFTLFALIALALKPKKNIEKTEEKEIGAKEVKKARKEKKAKKKEPEVLK